MIDSIPNWAADYIGIPFVEHGRGHAGCDCWGLVRLVLAEQFDIHVNGFEQSYKTVRDKDTIAEICRREALAWQSVKNPQPGDVVLLRIQSVPYHVGIVIGKNSMLHVERNKNTVREKFNSSIWKNRIAGFYRYAQH